MRIDLLVEFCYKCKYYLDNGESLHFNRCHYHCICIDCSGGVCDGKDFKEKET